jgi:polar amino acid transport system substrate-binding protein
MVQSARGSRQSALDKIRKRGLIRVAATWSNTAEQYLDPDTRAPMGVVGHVGRLLAQDLGVNVEFVDVPWGEQIPALLEGRVDICLKHTNRPDRALAVDFCTGRLERYEGKIVIRRDSGIRTESDLNDPARVIAATAGSHQEMQVRERYPAARLRTYANAHEGMLGVLRREADACLADASIPNFLLLHQECAVLLDQDGRPVITSLDFAHPCINGGDQRFLNWLNNWMDFHHVQGSFEKLIAQAYREHEAKFDRIMAQFEPVASGPASRDASLEHGRA